MSRFPAKSGKVSEALASSLLCSHFVRLWMSQDSHRIPSAIALGAGEWVADIQVRKRPIRRAQPDPKENPLIRESPPLEQLEHGATGVPDENVTVAAIGGCPFPALPPDIPSSDGFHG